MQIAFIFFCYLSASDAILHRQRASNQRDEVFRHQRSQGGSLNRKNKKKKNKTEIRRTKQQSKEQRMRAVNAAVQQRNSGRQPPPSVPPSCRHLMSPPSRQKNNFGVNKPFRIQNMPQSKLNLHIKVKSRFGSPFRFKKTKRQSSPKVDGSIVSIF